MAHLIARIALKCTHMCVYVLHTEARTHKVKCSLDYVHFISGMCDAIAARPKYTGRALCSLLSTLATSTASNMDNKCNAAPSSTSAASKSFWLGPAVSFSSRIKAISLPWSECNAK